jgi:hypothetical protein
MSLFTSTAYANIARRMPSLTTRRVQFYGYQQPTKSWLNRCITSSKYPRTDAFVNYAQTIALPLSVLALSLAMPAYLIYEPYPPRMLKMMSEMSPDDAARLWEREHEPIWKLY